jgi:pimeloyl-ACP methyl ester carboxylesterase
MNGVGDSQFLGSASCWSGGDRTILPIWNTLESLRSWPLRPLIVHGGHDRLFPQQMAADLAAECGASAELVIVPGQRHSEPYYHPQLSYWSNVIRRLVSAAE